MSKAEAAGRGTHPVGDDEREEEGKNDDCPPVSRCVSDDCVRTERS